MRLDLRMAFACVALALAACQGGYSSGGAGAPLPPVSGSNAVNSVPVGGSASPSSALPSTPPGDTVTYPFAQAAQGLQCPQSQGFTCLLRLNIGSSSSPLPSAKPAPSGSTVPSASPSPGTTITIAIAGTPNDAPALPNPTASAKPTVALVRLRLTVNTDVMLQGNANASFILPADEAVSGRAFAVGLFHETVRRRHRDDKFFGSYAKSTLDGNTLRFAFTPPKVPVKKDEVWLLVLYGDQIVKASSAPATTSTSSGFNPAGGFSKPNPRSSP